MATRRTRYRQEPVPGLPGGQAREYDPPGLFLAPQALQGFIPYSDGSQLGPLFTLPPTTEKP